MDPRLRQALSKYLRYETSSPAHQEQEEQEEEEEEEENNEGKLLLAKNQETEEEEDVSAENYWNINIFIIYIKH